MSSRLVMPFAGNNRPKEQIHSYPRPPALEKTSLRLQVIWVTDQGEETLLVDSTNAYMVKETTHPPTYYFPSEDASGLLDRLKKNSQTSFCEWKGSASYYDFSPPGSNVSAIKSRVWTYSTPTARFKPLAGYLAMYAETGNGARGAGGEWKCFVEGEFVTPQPGNFYGSWKTAEHVGTMKGGAGTYGW